MYDFTISIYYEKTLQDDTDTAENITTWITGEPYLSNIPWRLLS